MIYDPEKIDYEDLLGYFPNLELQPLSQSGDSILTDIIDGIAHSAIVLADVSTIGNDSKTGPFIAS